MLPTFPPAVSLRLLIIRSALLLGVLLFGAVTWYTRRSTPAPVADAELLRVLGLAFMGMAAAALAALFVLRRRLEGLAGQQAFITYIVGYAFAEGVALFGCVIWFLGGPSAWYFAGLLLMVASFQVLPVNRA